MAWGEVARGCGGVLVVFGACECDTRARRSAHGQTVARYMARETGVMAVALGGTFGLGKREAEKGKQKKGEDFPKFV